MNKILIALLFLTPATFAYAKVNKHTTQAIDVTKIKKVKKIKVFGMACPMCQSKAINKFEETKVVENTIVDMEKMLITLTLKEGKKLSTEQIKKVVTSLGLEFKGLVN